MPEALADQILAISRRLDQGELYAGPNPVAIKILREALTLKANAGGVIKQHIRSALALLEKD